jgi:hypothetical protein
MGGHVATGWYLVANRSRSLPGLCRTGTILTMRGNRLSAASSLVMLLAVLAGCDGGSPASVGHGPPSAASTAPPSTDTATSRAVSAPGPEADADYLRIAARESERTLGLAPMPSGARRLPARPEGWPRSLRLGVAPEDTRLTRMAWYAVPLSVDAVQEFFDGHHPRGMVYSGGGFGLGTGQARYRALHPRRPEAYTDPWLLVQWRVVGSGTVIRYGAVLASRQVRDPATVLPAGVTSVDVEHLRDPHTGPNSARVVATVHFAAAANPKELRAVIAIVDGLPGFPVGNVEPSCDFFGSDTYGFTFHTATAELVYRWSGGAGGGGCSGLELLRDGQPVGDGLDTYDLYRTMPPIFAHPRPGQ